MLRANYVGYLNSTHYHAIVKGIGKDPDQAKPNTKVIYKTALNMLPDQCKSILIDSSARIQNIEASKLVSGEVMPSHFDILPFVIIAAIAICNIYYETDVIKLLLMQNFLHFVENLKEIKLCFVRDLLKNWLIKIKLHLKHIQKHYHM